MSYANKDGDIANRFRKRLEDKDYLVFNANDIPAGADLANAAATAISNAAKDGCVLLLLTPNTIKSKFVLREICFTYSQKGNIIAVKLGDFELSEELKYYLYQNPLYKLSENPTDNEIDEIIDKIGRAIIK